MMMMTVVVMVVLVITRLPSNPRPTMHECVHLVTRGHFRSRDKDGGPRQSIRHSRKPHATRKLRSSGSRTLPCVLFCVWTVGRTSLQHCVSFTGCRWSTESSSNSPSLCTCSSMDLVRPTATISALSVDLCSRHSTYAHWTGTTCVRSLCVVRTFGTVCYHLYAPWPLTLLFAIC